MSFSALGWVRLLIFITGVATLFWSAFTYLPFLERAEQWLQDYRYGVFGEAEPPREGIVVLAVGERTLESFAYRSPVDRGFLAGLIGELNAAGVRAIGLDVLLDQPTEPEKDLSLLNAIRESAVPVTLAWVDAVQQERFMTPRQREFLRDFLDRSGALPGLVTLVGLEGGSTVRQMNFGEADSTSGVPGFSVALARSVGETWLPDDPTIVFRLPPSDGSEAFPVYELRPELLGVFPPPQWLKGKIVMVGAVRPYEDRHPTPLAVAFGAARGMLPGVVLHTHVLAQLLEQRSARSLGAPLTWGLFALLSVLGALLAAVETRAWVSVSIAAGLVVALWAASFVSFLDGYPPLPLLGPSAVFVVTLLAVGTWLGRHERRQRRFLRRAFSRYVSPTVVEAVCAKPDSLALGGERRELSFVFTDVEGFTTLSESLEPEALGELFNQYLNGIVKLIFEYDGTLEKFVGDAVMTMFGAPLRQPDHACRALDFALAVDRWTREFEALQLSRGIAFGRTRVGVNSGVATVGNFGGTLQFSYTAHGDCVNTAARLETLNKHLRTRVCVGARTAELCSDRPLRPVGDVVLKGKSEGLRVYEYHVQDSRDHSPRVDYMAAFRRLEQGDHGAAPHFESLRRAFPDDPLLQYHCERLLDGQQGVRIVMETK